MPPENRGGQGGGQHTFHLYTGQGSVCSTYLRVVCPRVGSLAASAPSHLLEAGDLAKGLRNVWFEPSHRLKEDKICPVAGLLTSCGKGNWDL